LSENRDDEASLEWFNYLCVVISDAFSVTPFSSIVVLPWSMLM
jgi:hypothetical protein